MGHMANIRAARAIAAATTMWAVIGLTGGIGMAQGPARPQPATAPATATTSPALMLEKGIYTEETVGDLDAAIKIYRQIVDDDKAARKYAAQAQYRLGMCYLKKGRNAEAISAFNGLIMAFSDQKELVAKARKQIPKARKNVSDAEIAKIVDDAVTGISTMADGDSRIRPLLESLAELREPAVVEAVAKYFDSDKDTIRRAAIYIIWKDVFSDPSPALEGVVKLCSHKEDVTRGMAALALGTMKANSAFDTLADMTANDKSPFARRCAAYSLGLLGDQRARPVLEKALKDPEIFVRNNAEAALTMLAKAGATGSAAPRVIKTTPEAFANNVDPSLDKITVTFDRPMMDKSWSFTGGGETFPQRTGEISYDAARTTCTMPVKLQPGKVYWVGINSPSHKNFKSADGTPAARYVLLFATKSADGKPTPLPQDLLKEAKEVNAASRAGGIASYAVELKDNWALDLDTGKSVQLEKDWADAYEVAWDNDIGGTLMIKPQSQKVRIMAVPEASDLVSAVRKALEPDMRRLLALSQEHGVPAKRSRFAAVLTDQGQIAVIEVSRFTPKDALLQCVVGPAASQPAVAGERDQQRPLAEARQVGLAFLQLLQAGQAQPALALTTPDYRKAHPKGFDELAKRIDFSSAKVADVLASPDSACVTLSGVVPPGRKESMSLGLGLHREGGKLLIRDVDALPNENAKQEFIAGFQRSLFAAEPARREYIDPVYLRHAEELSVEGWALWNQRKLAEAEEKFKTAVAMDPTNANAWNGLGWSQLNQGKPINAKEAFEKAVAADPKLAGALNGLGMIARGNGKIEQAIEYWQRAVAAMPNATAAWSGLAGTYAELGEYDKAIDAYEKWVKAEPGDDDARESLAKARQADKALLAGANAWLGLIDKGEYVKAWEQAGPMLRTIVDDKDTWAKVTKAVRDDVGKVKSRKLQSRQLMMRIPGLIGGPFQVLVYYTQFEKKHMNENVVMQKDHLNTWGVVGYTLAPYSMTMSGSATMSTANVKDVPKEATAAAEQWLGLVDGGKYAESWDAAAEKFQKGVSKPEWQLLAANARKPLGKLKARKFVDAANVSTQPDGPVDKNVLVFQFQAAYEKRDNAVETVSLMKGKDGKWRVAGYFIR